MHEQLQMLQGRNLIREQEPGRWVRKVLDEKTGAWAGRCRAGPAAQGRGGPHGGGWVFGDAKVLCWGRV